jgi:hypothetical protein
MDSRFLLALLVLPAPLAAQSTWCEYRPDSVRGVIAAHASGLNDSLGPEQRAYVLALDRPGLLLSLVYTGERRPLLSESARFLDAFFLNAVRDTISRLYFTEAGRFRDEGSSYWFPIQDSLLPDLQREAAPGDTVFLFARWLGAWQLGRTTEWVFVVNEFATPSSAAAWEEALKSCPGHQ